MLATPTRRIGGVLKDLMHCVHSCLTPCLLTRTYLLGSCSFLDVICNDGWDGLANDLSYDFTNSYWSDTWTFVQCYQPGCNKSSEALGLIYAVHMCLPTMAMAVHSSLEALCKDEHMHLHTEESIPEGPAAPEGLSAVERMRDPLGSTKMI